MAELNEWQKALVVQKDGKLGAIVAGYEWMIRFNKVNSVDFDSFQDDFNLHAKGEGQNTFGSIAKAVEKKYPHISIQHKSIHYAREKIQFVKDLIDQNIPCMMKFAISYKENVAHEMPVVIYDERYMRFVWQVLDINNPNMLRVEYPDIGNRHIEWPEAREVAWLQPR